MLVCAEGAAEAVASSYVEVGASVRVGDRLRQGVQRAGVCDDLLSLVTACLAKDPCCRPSSAVVAQKTGELLGEQATQVLGDVHDRPTEVPNLIAEQWHPPTVEDPAWPAPDTRRPGRRAWLIVAAAAVFAAAATGTWFALASGYVSARATHSP